MPNDVRTFATTLAGQLKGLIPDLGDGISCEVDAQPLDDAHDTYRITQSFPREKRSPAVARLMTDAGVEPTARGLIITVNRQGMTATSPALARYTTGKELTCDTRMMQQNPAAFAWLIEGIFQFEAITRSQTEALPLDDANYDPDPLQSDRNVALWLAAAWGCAKHGLDVALADEDEYQGGGSKLVVRGPNQQATGNRPPIAIIEFLNEICLAQYGGDAVIVASEGAVPHAADEFARRCGLLAKEYWPAELQDLLAKGSLTPETRPASQYELQQSPNGDFVVSHEIRYPFFADGGFKTSITVSPDAIVTISDATIAHYMGGEDLIGTISMQRGTPDAIADFYFRLCAFERERHDACFGVESPAAADEDTARQQRDLNDNGEAILFTAEWACLQRGLAVTRVDGPGETRALYATPYELAPSDGSTNEAYLTVAGDSVVVSGSDGDRTIPLADFDATHLNAFVHGFLEHLAGIGLDGDEAVL